MTTDEPAVREAGTRAEPEAPRDAGEAAPEATAAREPSWWHRDHPTFAALSGFFTGLVFVAVIPAVYVGVLSLMFDTDRVEELFPFVLVTLVVPLALVANHRTRRFGTYFWVGMLLTAVVVVGVGALVLWYLFEHQG